MSSRKFRLVSVWTLNMPKKAEPKMLHSFLQDILNKYDFLNELVYSILNNI